MKQPSPKRLDYLVRDIPRDVWSKMAARAVEQQVTRRVLVIEAIKAYLAKGNK